MACAAVDCRNGTGGHESQAGWRYLIKQCQVRWAGLFAMEAAEGSLTLDGVISHWLRQRMACGPCRESMLLLYMVNCIVNALLNVFIYFLLFPKKRKNKILLYPHKRSYFKDC